MADGVPTSEAIPAAIVEHTERRRHDPAFQARLQRIIEEERVVLERLGDATREQAGGSDRLQDALDEVGSHNPELSNG